MTSAARLVASATIRRRELTTAPDGKAAMMRERVRRLPWSRLLQALLILVWIWAASAQAAAGQLLP